MVKANFGNLVTRLLWGGVTLSLLESELLERMVAALPEMLRATVEDQFEAYNLAQREADGRALNFYRKRIGRVGTGGVPLLTMKGREAPLIRVTFVVGKNNIEHHAVLTAVDGRAFCLTFDQDVRSLPASREISIKHLTHSWRSNFNAT